MDLPIETKISQLVAKQFPAFYSKEGPTFIAFLRAYYEFLESQNQQVYHSRRMRNYTDVDLTPEAFLEHFQRKYVYGIPFDVIVNKRFLIKHVLDVYRSKGSILCYKLLFRMIYDQDVDVYLPGVDLLRPSDGTWKVPLYIEMADPFDKAKDMVGATIYGVSSKTTAVVESFVTEALNSNLIKILYISNVNPRGGEFLRGEKIVMLSDRDSEDLSDIMAEAPTIVGSLGDISIISGGQGFSAGDVLGVAHRDLSDNDVISFGVSGKVRVTKTLRGQGQIFFDVVDGGGGYSANSRTFLYNDPTDTTGQGASFEVGSLSFVAERTYNTDLLMDYANVALNAVSFGFPGDPLANVSTPLEDYLTYETKNFGTIATLTNMEGGNSYTQQPLTFVRDFFISKARAGNVSYNTASNTVTGTNTAFTTFFSNGDIVCLQANAASAPTKEYHIIKQVVNATSMNLYGPPSRNSTANNAYYYGASIFKSNFDVASNVLVRSDGSYNGFNANISAYPGIGNSVVTTVGLLDSGKGYVNDEVVKLYLADTIAPITIQSGGTGYKNNETLMFRGGNPVQLPEGYVTTNTSGGITAVVLTYPGCGFQSIPNVLVKTTSGNGALLTTELSKYSADSVVIGRVQKQGIGRGRGYWTTTNGFLNSDKYIQDSYFYQDFSYQLKAATLMNKYRDILYDTFHIAGTELFGDYLLSAQVESSMSVASGSGPTLS